MHKKLFIALVAINCCSIVFGQTDSTATEEADVFDQSAITFSEAQLGEDENVTQNVTILNSNTNVYASEVGWSFSPMRFRYRAFNQKYNDVFINGSPMNELESGQFRYSYVGGLNQQTKNVDFSLPFEINNFAFPNMGGSNNYDFRAGSMAAGHRLTLSAVNRNYKLRGMYTYGSGFNNDGWAFAGNITYRWANEGIAEGTFYNALSYFLGVQKKWENGHSLSLSAWGNPTERSSQGASTEEAYWLANDYLYNPYWGYQNGKKRNSRIINDFTPAGLLTWDWRINERTSLTTSFLTAYSMYKNTRLNYNNSENPQPDYWKSLPSSFYDVWDANDASGRNIHALSDWQKAFNYWTESKENRQIKWEQLYYANRQAGKNGGDALYYVQARHSNNLMTSLSSCFSKQINDKSKFNGGLILNRNQIRHFLTMEDLLGAASYHNINNYALGTYAVGDPRIQYDLNTVGTDGKGKEVKEGDKFAYDYDIIVRKANAWTNYSVNAGPFHFMIAGRLSGTEMQRNGYMRNGMFKDNSYGKSGQARFLDGGGKGSMIINAGRGNTISLGAGYEWRSPDAKNSFVSPEMNNDFVNNLKNERIFSSEIQYQLQNAWLHANLNAYYSQLKNVTEWQNYYFDNINSFSYVSMTGIEKAFYGVELGLRFKLTSALDLIAIGHVSDAKNTNNSPVRYLNSTSSAYTDDLVLNKNMRESGTPLTAASIGFSYHQHGWFIDVNENYYDRIYLSYSPSMRYEKSLIATGKIDNEGQPIVPGQAMGKGGFMTDFSVGKSIYVKGGSLSINLNVTNLLNNQKMISGGYEQSRADTSFKTDGTVGNERIYKFSQNPKVFHIYGINGMLNIAYRF